MGRWRKEAAKFLKANEKVLAEQLVWLFSSGSKAFIQNIRCGGTELLIYQTF
jgi:hypothetical protein